MSHEINWPELEKAAKAAQAQAYAPYSRYTVGAALQDSRGRIFAGCNVENASYGLSMCAERNAVFAGVTSGLKNIEALLLVVSGAEAATPCGACRQVLAEFGNDYLIRCIGHGGNTLDTSLSELLPHAFGPRALG